MDRFHLVMDVIDRVPGLGPRAADLRQEMVDERLRHRAYTREIGDDPPDDPRLDLARADARARPRRQRRLEQPQAPRRSTATSARLSERPRRAERAASTPAPSRGARAAGPGRRRRPPDRARRRALPRAGASSTPRSSRRWPSSPTLAPLHQPKSLAALDAVERRCCRDVPAVACFDTAFHATLPAAAATYALPRRWRERWGLRRYGFHGLSHASARGARRAARPAARGLRLVTCHLGAGASLAAVRDGRSVDTTMGFTPLDGPRHGDALGQRRSRASLLWLLEHAGLERARDGARARARVRAARRWRATPTCARCSAAPSAATTRACSRSTSTSTGCARGIAAMAAALGGLDALVFTGGVGEHAADGPRARPPPASASSASRSTPARNARRRGRRATIGAPGAPVRTLVVAAREDLEIARQVDELDRLSNHRLPARAGGE